MSVKPFPQALYTVLLICPKLPPPYLLLQLAEMGGSGGGLSVNIKFAQFGKHYSGHRLDEKKVVIDLLIIMIGLFTVLEVSALFHPLVTYLSANFLTIVMYLLIWFILSVFGKRGCIFRVIFFFFQENRNCSVTDMQYPLKPHPPFVVQGMEHKDLLGKLQYHKSTSQVHLFLL